MSNVKKHDFSVVFMCKKYSKLNYKSEIKAETRVILYTCQLIFYIIDCYDVNVDDSS